MLLRLANLVNGLVCRGSVCRWNRIVSKIRSRPRRASELVAEIPAVMIGNA